MIVAEYQGGPPRDCGFMIKLREDAPSRVVASVRTYAPRFFERLRPGERMSTLEFDDPVEREDASQEQALELAKRWLEEKCGPIRVLDRTGGG